MIHFGPPKTLESYYQQIGRAGRDGYTSKCIMLCDENDFASYQSDFYIGNLQGMAKDMTLRSIQALRDFAMNQDQCRRVSLLKFFEETPPYDRCGTCDTCLVRQKHKDDLERDFGPSGARLVLYTLSALKPRTTMSVMLNVLSGKIVESYRYRNDVNSQEVQDKVQLMKSTFVGKKKKTKEYFKEILNALVERGYVSNNSQTIKPGGGNFSVSNSNNLSVLNISLISCLSMPITCISVNDNEIYCSGHL